MSTRHWNLEEVTTMVVGIPITEFSVGDAIEVTRPEPDWKKSAGHHGSVMRSKMPSPMGEAKIMVKQGSPINEQLQEIADQDRLTGRGTGEFYVKDTNGTSQAIAPTSWVEKVPDWKGSTEAGDVEWIIGLGNLEIKHGSNRLA